MDCQKGTVVLVTAGKEKGELYAIIGETNGKYALSNGKKRRLNKPKLKSAKHIFNTGTVLDKSAFKSNHELRIALNRLKGLENAAQ